MTIPWGCIIDCSFVALGGLLGGIARNHLSERICQYLSTLFGITSITVGVNLIGQTSALTPVMIALILGAILGEVVHLEQLLDRLPQRLSRQSGNREFVSRFTGVMVLLCSGSLGLMGAMTEGMTGDPSLLITKSVLDFSGAMVFASSLGSSVSLIALPQLALYLVLFATSRFFMPYVTEQMLCDFTACGGVIALATGLRVAEIKWMRIASLLPALLLILPISALWHTFF